MATSDKRHAELHAFDFSGIESKLDSSFACLNVIEKEVSIGLLPKYLGNENEFIKLVLDKKLGKFDDRLQCIPVKVRKIKKLGSTGIISGEDPCIYFKILAELIVFQPAVASQVAARVDKISHSHIGLLVHEWFNASISKNEKQTIPEISVGDEVLLEVIRSTVTRKILSLKGKFIKILKKTEGEPKQQEVVNGNADEDAELQKPATEKTKHREEIVELDMDQLEQSGAESLGKQSSGKKKKKHREKNSSKEGGDHGDSCIVETVGEIDQLDMSVSDINEEQPIKKKGKKNKENQINENGISNYTDKDEIEEICAIDESGDGKKHKKKKHKSRS